jgi:molybdopterin-guanine dinucleotide biosynthesis protein A
MPLFPNAEAFLLVGGKSTRMGRNKSLLEINGEPLIQRTANLLTPLVKATTLVMSVTQSSDSENKNSYSNLKLPIITDRYSNAGPLAGIATAVATAKTPWSLILACDMPFLTKEWLTFLLSQVSEAPEQTDAIVPETIHGLEPLSAIYRTACAPTLSAALARDERKVTDVISTLNLKRIGENQWRQFSPDGNLFGNLNTWQDYLDAQLRLKS